MKSATTMEQRELASLLVGSKQSVGLLVTLLENGHASNQLLAEPSVRARLGTIQDAAMKIRIEKLLADLPPEDAGRDKLIAGRVRDYLLHPGEAARGAVLFKKHCATCHRVARDGARVGPNLDGIGRRGLGRLAEDVLAPNRNVDINFRATTLVTDEGNVLTGWLKPSSGALSTIVNGEGKEISVPTESIEGRKVSRLSPMPANVVERLSGGEFRDLMSYLLSLTD